MRLGFTSLLVCLALLAALRAETEKFETADIQSRIDAAAATGGGTVTVAKGDHYVGSLELKSGVTLELAEGCRLVASTNWQDYALMPNYRHQRAVVRAHAATNVALVGKGEIDGRGWAVLTKDGAPRRWKDCTFFRCRNVRVEGVTLRDAATWTCYFKECEQVVARRVTIRSNVNHNNDGIDIEARDVLVEDCDIVCGDDAICFKSDNPDFTVERCRVRNCRLSSNCNFIKCGTSSRGVYRDILVEDCHVECVKGTPCLQWRKNNLPGVTTSECGISAIALEVVDGGRMENVTVRNITIGKGVQTPAFIRQGARRAVSPGRESALRNVLVENVRMSDPAASRIACSITGVPGLRPRDIVLRNIDLVFPGGGTASDTLRKIGEFPKRYPENRMFGRDVALPAYGFYVRHADGVRFENVKLAYAGATEERPAIVAEDASVSCKGCDFKAPSNGGPTTRGFSNEQEDMR